MGNKTEAVLPPLKKRTRHWCSHGWSGSMANALFTDWSINRYFSEKRRHIRNRLGRSELLTKVSEATFIKNYLS